MCEKHQLMVRRKLAYVSITLLNISPKNYLNKIMAFTKEAMHTICLK